MRFSQDEIRHILNVEWGLRFWRWFRWVLALALVLSIVGGHAGWISAPSRAWLTAGFVYLLVAWPGMCRAYVYQALRRCIDEDPEAREQLEQAAARKAGH